MSNSYDIAIIGAGPGGYVAAIRAAQLGFKTVCIDQRSVPGGTCLNVGCIPSKALLQSTDLLARFQRDGKHHGLECSHLKVNFDHMMEHKKQIVESLVTGVAGLLQQHHVSTLHGQAEFIDSHRLRIVSDQQSQEIDAAYILIATGSQPIELPNLPFDERQIVSSTGALSLPKIPTRLIVVGGGVIGVELASVYSRLGSKVTIIEMLDRLCPALDFTLSKQLLQVLKKQGIDFYLSSQVLTAVIQPEEVILTFQQNEKLQNASAEIVLVAVGRRPYTTGLQLEKIGIQIDKRGFIPVDQAFRTVHPHIFAIGDVIDGTMLAHRASAEAIVVVESLKGEFNPIQYLAIPNVVYTDPEVASVGLSEQEAKEADLECMVGTSYFRGNARARCSSEMEGLVKVIGDKKTGSLLGLHIIGAHASELIAEGMIAMQKRASVKELAEAPQAHPTLSEAIKEAALDALGRPLHH